MRRTHYGSARTDRSLHVKVKFKIHSRSIYSVTFPNPVRYLVNTYKHNKRLFIVKLCSVYSVGPALSSQNAGERHGLLIRFSAELENRYHTSEKWKCRTIQEVIYFFIDQFRLNSSGTPFELRIVSPAARPVYLTHYLLAELIKPRNISDVINTDVHWRLC